MPRSDDRRALLRWYRQHRRELPWRSSSDPYAIWVSEIMLQQTQVTTVVPYYERFLERFPNVAALAAADEEEVLARWSGLGYYRRAKSLHRGAQLVVSEFGGQLPETVEELLKLPGIGRYTAGAIGSIAFGLAAPILDGNVRRVLSRRHAIDGDALGNKAEQELLWRLAEELVAGDAPGDLNQALMELGALVCTPRAPDCDRCPWTACCEARIGDAIDRYPVAVKRKPTTKIDVAVALVRRADRVLLERPAAAGPLRGRWDLPAIVVEASDPQGQLTRYLAERHQLAVGVGDRLGSANHGILHRRLTLETHKVTLRRGAIASISNSDALRWIALDELSEAAISGATSKALRSAKQI
jgi:A/G-specific adenine glycosylase